jgi:integrase
MRGEAVPTKVPTLADFSTQFLNYLPSRVKPGSFRLYTTCWAHLTNSPLAPMRLTEINRSVVDRFAQEKLASGLAVITVNSILRTLRRALFLAHEWELIPKRPGFVKLLPNENRRTFVVDEATEARLVGASSDLMRQLIPFAIDTGLRAGEIVALTWNDVDYIADEPIAVHVRAGKTRFARRTVPLTKRAAANLVALRAARVDGCAHVFTRYEGRHPLTVEWMSGRFKRTRRPLGISEECCFHSLRHTACTRWGAAGASAFEIQRLAGHSSIEISARYTHPEQDQLRAAIARMGK